jgi:hypothetical protein
MRKFTILSILIISLLFGCLSKTMDSWLESLVDRLVESWGAPTSTYTKSDGGKILTYSEMWSNQYGIQTCVKTFQVDSNGIIEGWSYNGCRAF